MAESLLWLLLDVRRARKQGPAAVARRQRARLADMVAFARANSPYYRERYRNLPERVDDAALLPVTNKKALMARFDDWLCDRYVTIEKVRARVDDPERIGERFLGKYTVATTSGTTGTRGIFLMDDRSLAVTTALVARMLGAWLNASDVIRIVAGGGRMAQVIATGGHFASMVAATRLRKRRGDAIRVFPVSAPLPEIVAGLNRFRPAILASYASMGALLAGEQEAGRLRINPVLVGSRPRDWRAASTTGSPAPSRPRSARAMLPRNVPSSVTAARMGGRTSTATGWCSSRWTPTTGPRRRGSSRTRCW